MNISFRMRESEQNNRQKLYSKIHMYKREQGTFNLESFNFLVYLSHSLPHILDEFCFYLLVSLTQSLPTLEPNNLDF